MDIGHEWFNCSWHTVIENSNFELDCLMFFTLSGIFVLVFECHKQLFTNIVNNTISQVLNCKYFDIQIDGLFRSNQVAKSLTLKVV